MRWKGYGRYFSDKSDVKDRLDFNPGSIIILAVDREDNPVGTLRLLDSSKGETELESFVDLNALLSSEEKPYCEFTRFSVPKHKNSIGIKIALMKTAYLYCRRYGINCIVMSAIDKLAKLYMPLGFEYMGEKGDYKHHLLGNNLHRSYKLPMHNIEEKYYERKHPFANFFVKENHPNIIVN